MSLSLSPHTSGRIRLKRAALLLVGAAVFVGVASVIKPPPQAASAGSNVGGAGRPRQAQQQTTGSQLEFAIPTHPQGWKLLGILQGREFVTLCYGSPDGARYSVFTAAGVLMQADMPADEVYRSFPDVDLENMLLEPGDGVPIMLMDRD